MVVMTSILYILSFPYLYFGTDIFLMITAGAIFNIGFNSLFLLYAGSFNRKRIDLTKGGFGNTLMKYANSNNSVKISSFAYAYKWDGQAKYSTDPMGGH